MNQTRKIQNVMLFISDFICLIGSYYISGAIWLKWFKGLSVELSINTMNEKITTVVATFALAFIFYSKNGDFLLRGKYDEAKNVIKTNVVMACIIAVYELLARGGNRFPRGLYVMTILLNVVIVYIVRNIIKAYMVNVRGKSIAASKLMLITTKDRAEEVVKLYHKHNNWSRQIAGIAVVDEDMIGQCIHGIPIIANYYNMITYMKNEIVDEVYISIGNEKSKKIYALIMELEEMGITVHLKLEMLDEYKDFDISLGKMGDVPVVTFANRFYDYKEMAVKRFVDIIGGLVGFIIFAVSYIFVAPAIKIESKGPVLFKQKRVGKNGRYFYVYKYRSMYQDAEERKKELLAKNEMSGLMFKMKDDPRITNVGKFIRKTSIDELPQFINVLKGDMSLVGTRPPTVGEFKQYEGHHKRRLSMKPGITGMWQAYGRQTVTDFEEIVAMDLDYIDHWSMGLDIKILFRTVFSVLGGSGQ